MSKKRKTKASNKIVQHRSREVSQDKCIFCGATSSLERHHIIQKRFQGSNDPSNLVPICSRCHRTLHFLVDTLLDHLIQTGKLHEHEIRPPSKEVKEYLKRLIKDL